MIYFDNRETPRPFILVGNEDLVLVSHCCSAPIKAEAPLSGIWASFPRTFRPDGLLAICSACRCYVEDDDGTGTTGNHDAGTPWLATDTPLATLDDVRRELDYADMENAR